MDLSSAVVAAGVGPRAPGAEMIRHVFPEDNSATDRLAGSALQEEVRHNMIPYEYYRRHRMGLGGCKGDLKRGYEARQLHAVGTGCSWGRRPHTSHKLNMR